MLMMNQLIGFGAAESGIWQPVTSVSLTTETGGWTGYTICGFIPQAALLVTGGTSARLTVTAANGLALQGVLYVGRAASGWSESAPSFDTTPVHVLFGGGDINILAAATALSDAFTLPIPTSQGFAYALYVSGGGSIRETAASTPVNFRTCFKNANDPSTPTKSGYTSNTTNFGAHTVSLVEALI